MRGNLGISAAVTRLKSRALGTTALTVVALLAAPAAWAQTVTPPAAGSLPGSTFTSNLMPTYAGTSATAATINVPAGNTVLQWGGTALINKITATGTTSGMTNTGFSIGSGATLSITNTAAGATGVLVTDQTGNPSQIYGTLSATTLPAAAPLYVSNVNGVIVGPAGVINAPAAGVGLLGYGVDTSLTGFPTTGAVSVTNATTGGGAVTIMNGATINGGAGVSVPLLVASNGTVNIGATALEPAVPAATNYVLAGWQFSTVAGSVVPVPVAPPAGARSDIASSVVNFTAPATLTVDELYAGAVNNGATLTLTSGIPALVPGGVVGLFTNTGTLNENGELGANQLAGGLANLGTINELAAAGLAISSTKGNVQSTGVLNLTGAGPLNVSGANVDLEGAVQIGGKPLSTTNQLTGLFLSTLTKTVPQAGGVVDIATSLFSNANDFVEGNAIRFLSGGIFASAGSVFLEPGTNAGAVADPFYKLTSLGYTLSLFPGTQVSDTAALSVIDVVNPAGSTSFTNSSGLNLDGQLADTGTNGTINVIANNIHSNDGLAGGFSVANGGVINLQFFGNVNNPAGAAANGSTSFLYNYVPVTVGANGPKAGTALVTLAGPSYSSATEQFVNLLVQGNVNLADGSGNLFGFTTIPLTAPGPFPTAPVSPYANNHLVVTATGNIGLDPSLVASLGAKNAIFYWPGLVNLTSGATASNPTAAPNSTASIALGDSSSTFAALYLAPLTPPPENVNLSNIIPADLTKASIGGQTGSGGVHYLTNNLILTPSTGGGTGTTTISNDSWANFLNATIASAFATTSPAQFLGGTIQTNGQVNTQKLPAADFQP